MELPKINKSQKHNVFGPLKFNSRYGSADKQLLNNLQSDNVFFKKKLAEFEVRLDNITQTDQFTSETTNSIARELEKNSKFNRFKNAKLRESAKRSAREEVPPLNDLLLRKESTCSQIPTARLNTGRSSLLTARTTDSVSKIDDILDNLKKHRRSAVRRDAFEQAKTTDKRSASYRPKTSANLPNVSRSVADDDDNKLNEILARKSGSIKKSASRKSRAKTARDETVKDDDYCHMFYSRSWRIHPELGIIKDKDRTTYDNTQTNFYHTKREPPETFIFAPDWV